MPNYLFHGTYVGDGLKGLLKDGGTGRVKAAREVVESMGGTLETMYFSFGKDDYFIIASLPDNVSAAAVALTVAASGRVSIDTTVLLTPEEVDSATQRHPDYRAPGA
ncbi:MAG: hypothetical protein QOH61_619 [Chloroflexota bacterium]|jgi:uncharacterized protein with GYD domain|nr:hypothetical protein [Chloroflexota bacterium]